MSFKIDDAFIRQWEPRFDERGIGGEYESEYPTLVSAVAVEIKSLGTLSKTTFSQYMEVERGDACDPPCPG
jgi:hypothetical protein